MRGWPQDPDPVDWPSEPPRRRQWVRIVLVVAITVLGAVLIVRGTFGAPPANADPALGPFFKSLRQPDTGYGCCDMGDCRPVTGHIRHSGGKVEVFIRSDVFPLGTDEWVEVPPSKMIRGVPNQAGEPIACWTKWQGLLCFLDGGSS